MYEVRKYKAEGEWSAWKVVDEATAMHKASVIVKVDTGWGEDEQEVKVFHPYEIRKVEA